MAMAWGARRAGIASLLVGAILPLAGCGGSIEPEATVSPGYRCVDDSIACVSHRQSVLRGLLADPKRHWVREPADANAYATGVRLFAFKTKKRELTCPELALGRREADAGPAVLRGPQGRHLTPAQVSRGAMLSTEVSRELGKEMGRRCPA